MTGRGPVRLVIVSGGQTGVDRAALDAAILAGVPYDGWCPAGGWAEDLPDPPGLLAHYPRLRETMSADPAERTRLNVRDSDATLVVQPSGGLAGGTLLTAEETRRLGRPLLVTSGDSVDEVVAWVRSIPSVHDTIRLDAAGPRESGHPGACALTRRLLDAVLQAGAG